MNKDFENVPLSELNVSLKLADIQKRCSEFIDEPDYLSGLSLEEPVVVPDHSNPYNYG